MSPKKLLSNTTRLVVEYLDLASLKPNPKNTRWHPGKQITKLCKVIDAHGFTCPLVIDEDNMILAGHARYAAAERLEMPSVPCVRLTHLTPHQKTAFAIADNKLSDELSFDDKALNAVLKELADVSFDMELTGFDMGVIDFRLDGAAGGGLSDPDDEFSDPSAGQRAVSQVGDLWRLGDHRLFCGSALEADSYEALLEGDRAQLIFTDPPYGVPISGHVSGLGRNHHREFVMGSGEMSPEEFRRFLAIPLQLCAKFSVDGSIHFVCMDWRHVQVLLEVGAEAYTELKNICVWAKASGGMGSLYRSEHELVLVFKNGAAPHQNNVELGKHGRYRTNIWNYPGANTFGGTRDTDLARHPTVKPVALVADAIRDCSKRGAIVLDPFVGSGTTILAAERSGRRAAAIELDPLYVDTAIDRWRQVTGKPVTLAGDGRSFDEIAKARAELADDASSSIDGED